MTLRLMVTTPLNVLLNEGEVLHVRAEDASGSFGILPGHADMLTALTTSVVAWRAASGQEGYVAVRGGLLRVSDGDAVEIATREAAKGDDLAALEETVLARYLEAAEAEQAARTQAARLQTAAIHQIIRYLRGHRGGPQQASRLQPEQLEGDGGA